MRHLECGRALAIGTALPHHVDAQSRVRHVSADVHVVLPAGEKTQVLGIGLPSPRHAVDEDRMRNVLDAFHQADQQVVLFQSTRREADAAVAHDHGGHAVG